MKRIKSAYLEQTVHFQINENLGHAADAVNSAAPDLFKEQKEFSEINVKIANGVEAVLSGMNSLNWSRK